MEEPTPSPEWQAFRAEIRIATARKAYRTKRPKAVTANGLTRQIVKFLSSQGHFATQLQSVGTFWADLQKFVASRQQTSLPDVMAVVDRSSVLIEVKIGMDKLSADQKETRATLEKAGAMVLVVRDFQQFHGWFVSEFQTAPFT